MALSTSDVKKPPTASSTQQNEAYISALLREREGPNADVAAIDAELKAIGAAGKTPAKRATKLKKAKSGSAGSDES